MKRVGGRIRRLRRYFEHGQIEFSKNLNTSQGFISEVERGLKQPGMDMLCSLVTWYGANPYWICTGKGPMLLKDKEAERVMALPDDTASCAKGVYELDLEQARMAVMLNMLDDAARMEIITTAEKRLIEQKQAELEKTV